MEKKKKVEEKLPKVARLVSAIATFMDSGTDYGAEFSMTPLSEEIECHKNTIQNKLTEHFLMRDALKDWEPVWKNGVLERVRKIEPREANMEQVLVSLNKILLKLDEIKK
ncbi:hypothetical protein M0R04_09610 [Candidatus Dojkabacteria bacterium]|jgi:hypothetical protein|nr:hypothetical protein [Candidatus Dojkabacteria bacterium]